MSYGVREYSRELQALDRLERQERAAALSRQWDQMATELEQIRGGKPARKPILWAAVGRSLLFISAASCVGLLGLWMATQHRFGFALWALVTMCIGIKRARERPWTQP